MASDFDEWGPSAALLAGLGITASKVSQDLKNTGALSAPWKRSKKAKEVVRAVSAGRKGAPKVTAKDVMGRYRNLAQALQQPGRADMPADFAGRLGAIEARKFSHMQAALSTRALIDRFALHSKAEKLGIDTSAPSTLTSGQGSDLDKVEKLIGKSKELLNFMNSQAQPLGRSMNAPIMKVASNLGEGDHLAREILAQQAHAAERGLVNMQQYLDTDGNMRTVETIINETVGETAGMGVRTRLHAFDTKIPGTTSKTYLDSLEAAQGVRFDDSLIVRMKELNDRVSKHKDLSIRLRTLTENGQEMVTGFVLQKSGSNKPLMEASFVDTRRGPTFGRVLMGPGARPGVARMKLTGDAASQLASGRTLNQIGGLPKAAQFLDEYMLEQLLDENMLDEVIQQSSSGRAFVDRFAVSRVQEDVGANVLQWEANTALNAKRALQLSLRGVNDEEGTLKAVRGELAAFGDAAEGLNPSQYIDPLATLRPGFATLTPDDFHLKADAAGHIQDWQRVHGAMPVGDFMGDPSALAQMLRPQSFVEDEWRRAHTIGEIAAGTGDITPTLRVAHIPAELHQAIMGEVAGRADLGLHAKDEIIMRASVADRNIMTTRDLEVRGFGTQRLEQIVEAQHAGFSDDWREIARRVQARKIGVEKAAEEMGMEQGRRLFGKIEAQMNPQGGLVGQIVAGSLGERLKKAQAMADQLTGDMMEKFSRVGQTEAVQRLESLRETSSILFEISSTSHARLAALLPSGDATTIQVMTRLNSGTGKYDMALTEATRKALGITGATPHIEQDIIDFIHTTDSPGSAGIRFRDQDFFTEYQKEVAELATLRGGEHGVSLGTSYEGHHIGAAPGEKVFISELYSPVAEEGQTRGVIARGIQSEKMGEGWKGFGFKFTVKSKMGDVSMDISGGVADLIMNNPAAKAELERHIKTGDSKSILAMVQESKRRLAGRSQGAFQTSIGDIEEAGVLRAKIRGREVEALSTGAITKVGERELAPAVQSMADELAEIHARVALDRESPLSESKLWQRYTHGAGAKELEGILDLDEWQRAQDLDIKKGFRIPEEPWEMIGDLVEPDRPGAALDPTVTDARGAMQFSPEKRTEIIDALVAKKVSGDRIDEIMLGLKFELAALDVSPDAVMTPEARRAALESIQSTMASAGGTLDPQSMNFVMADSLVGNAQDQNLIQRFHHLAEGLLPSSIGAESTWRLSSMAENLQNNTELMAKAGKRVADAMEGRSRNDIELAERFLSATSTSEKKKIAKEMAESTVGRSAASGITFDAEGLKAVEETARADVEGLYGRLRTVIDTEMGEGAFRGMVGDVTSQGLKTRHIGLGEDPVKKLGTGKLGSLNEQIANNLMEQGGIMKDYALELLGRGRTNSEAATQLLKAIGTAQYKGSDLSSAVSLDSLAKFREKTGAIAIPASKDELARPGQQGLFAGSPEQRAGTLADLKSHLGMAADKDLVIDLGVDIEKATGQRYAYHIAEQFHGLTSGYREKGGTSIVSDYDKALSTLLRDLMTDDDITIRAQAVEDYREKVAKLATKKTGPLASMYKGRVPGSIQLQAQSGISEEVAKALGDQYAHGVGILEKDASRMAQDMGYSGDEITDYIKSLRAGDEAAVIARYPQTELHRATPLRLFSVDQALSEYVGGQLKQDPADAVNWYKKLGGSMGKLSALAGEGGVDTAQYLQENQHLITDILKSSYTSGRAYMQFDAVGALLHESALGVDTDADQVQLFLGKDKGLRKKSAKLARYNAELAEAYVENSKLRGKDLVGGELEDFLKTQRKGRSLRGKEADLYALAEENLTYKAYQKHIFGALKGSGLPEPVAEESLKYAADGTTSAAMRERHRAAGVLARLEKKDIGMMSNAAEFTRNALRGGVREGRKAVLQEVLTGILPEIPLKAKHPGTIRAIKEKRPEMIGDIIDVFQNAGRDPEVTVKDNRKKFVDAFRSLHSTVDDDVLDLVLGKDDNYKMIDEIMEAAATANKSGENALHRLMRSGDFREASGGTLDVLDRLLGDPTSKSRQAIVYGEEMSKMGMGESGMLKHKRNVEAAAKSFWGSVSKHKKPLLAGAGIAIAASMLTGSPGHISEAEAEGAKSIHKPTGDPSHPPMMTGNSARLDTGTSIRIRARSGEELDYAELSSRLNDNYPRANIGYNVIDDSTAIDDEYVRRALMR